MSCLLLLEEGVCSDQCVPLAKLLAFALLHSVLQGQICLLFQVFLDFYICIPVPYNEKDIFFGFQKVLSVFIEPFNFSFFSITSQISVHFQGKPLKIMVIQVYALTSNVEEAEVEQFYEDLHDLLEVKPPKDVLFIIGDWNAKVGSLRYRE